MQQYLPLAVLKRHLYQITCSSHFYLVAIVPTACGIETHVPHGLPRYGHRQLQQYLPLAVCDEGCEAAEEQSDNEARTSQVPERSEGKTKVIWKWNLLFTVLKPRMC